MKHGQKKYFMSLACLLSLIYLGGSAFATNIVTNGSFEAGNSGFSSSYSYNPGGMGAAGVYAIAGNPHALLGSWDPFGAQDGDLMMIANGGTNASTQLWAQTVTVAPHTTYYFSFWVASSHKLNPAELALSINSTPLGSITASTTTGLWWQFYNTWDSGDNTTAALFLVDLTTNPDGNDFCLDSIQMDRVNPVPVPSTVLLLGSGLAGLGFLRRKWGLKK